MNQLQLFLAISLIDTMIPNFDKLIDENFNISLSTYMKSFLVLILLIISK